MTCERCGRPCNGRYCRDCEREQHQEDYFGVPSDHFDEDQEDDYELTNLKYVGETKAEALRQAGYGSIQDISAASQRELASVDGFGMALAARIKADVDGQDTRGDDTESSEGLSEPCPICGYRTDSDLSALKHLMGHITGSPSKERGVE